MNYPKVAVIAIVAEVSVIETYSIPGIRTDNVFEVFKIIRLNADVYNIKIRKLKFV